VLALICKVNLSFGPQFFTSVVLPLFRAPYECVAHFHPPLARAVSKALRQCPRLSADAIRKLTRWWYEEREEKKERERERERTERGRENRGRSIGNTIPLARPVSSSSKQKLFLLQLQAIVMERVGNAKTINNGKSPHR